MGAIFTRTFGDGSVYPYLTLAGEEFVRPLSIGSDWTTLRLSMVCAVTPTTPGADITGISFFFGLCNYAGGSWASGYCTNAAGATFINGWDPGSLVYVSGRYDWNNMGGASKANNVLTRSNTGFLTITGAAIGSRYLFSFLITKGTTTTSILYLMEQTAFQNYTNAALLEISEYSTTTPTIYINGVSVTHGSTGITGINILDTPAPLDAINLYYSKSSNPLEVYGITVSRIA